MFSNMEGITVAATSLALQWGLLKAIDKLKEARTERAKDAARREVLEAMNQLEEARKKAGLPPK
jgi:type VI protein secretion system component VasF